AIVAGCCPYVCALLLFAPDRFGGLVYSGLPAAFGGRAAGGHGLKTRKKTQPLTSFVTGHVSTLLEYSIRFGRYRRCLRRPYAVKRPFLSRYCSPLYSVHSPLSRWMGPGRRASRGGGAGGAYSRRGSPRPFTAAGPPPAASWGGAAHPAFRGCPASPPAAWAPPRAEGRSPR